MHPLQDLGVSPAAEEAYLRLVERGEAPAASFPAEALAELRELGLVRVHGDLASPFPPQLALERIAQRHTREAALARDSAAVLAELWTTGIGQRDYLELLPSADAARAVLDRVQEDAVAEVRAMTVGNLASPDHKIVDGLFDALARGVSYRVIYGTVVLQDPVALRMVQECVDAGEQARVFPRIAMNLTVVDERWALLVARAPVAGKDRIGAVVVHHSPLLSGLVGIFEAFWRMAVPITSTEAADATSSDTKRLLTYLSAGLTDESIAREFGVSERTIARRISRLQETLGAQTRFQLGVQASRQGLL
ncbi:MAG TPA: LuxR C-terminal-related transcriptional regulator [Umezawaea sp.]|nr:LuxR C-terminal-related transcriptional regulator [Umezawaea sp.]